MTPEPVARCRVSRLVLPESESSLRPYPLVTILTTERLTRCDKASSDAAETFNGVQLALLCEPGLRAGNRRHGQPANHYRRSITHRFSLR